MQTEMLELFVKKLKREHKLKYVKDIMFLNKTLRDEVIREYVKGLTNKSMEEILSDAKAMKDESLKEGYLAKILTIKEYQDEEIKSEITDIINEASKKGYLSYVYKVLKNKNVIKAGFALEASHLILEAPTVQRADNIYHVLSCIDLYKTFDVNPLEYAKIVSDSPSDEHSYHAASVLTSMRCLFSETAVVGAKKINEAKSVVQAECISSLLSDMYAGAQEWTLEAVDYLSSLKEDYDVKIAHDILKYASTLGIYAKDYTIPEIIEDVEDSLTYKPAYNSSLQKVLLQKNERTFKNNDL